MRQFRLSLISLFVVAYLLVAASISQSATSGQVVLPEQEVRAAVERFLAAKLAGRDWETSISRLSFPKGVKVPAGVRDLEVMAPTGWNGWGAVSIALVVRVNGAVEQNLPVRLQVDARSEMVTATRQLLAGTVLAAGDLQMQKQDLAQADGYPVKNMSDAVGKKIRVTVRAGAPLKNNQLVSIPVIVSGQLVTIVAENVGLRITVAGRAKSSGGIGELIRVQNLTSGKEIPARVVDASTVEVGL